MTNNIPNPAGSGPSPRPRRVLSEVLRHAEEEGPQHIGTRRPFVVVPAGEWYAKSPPRKPMGRWLVENMPRGANLEIPATRSSRRETSFAGEEAE